MRTVLIDITGGMSLDGKFPGLHVGEAYYGRVTASGGTSFYTYRIVRGVLPDGLELDRVTGEVTGIPTATQMFAITVRATDLQGMWVERAFVIPGSEIIAPKFPVSFDMSANNASTDGSGGLHLVGKECGFTPSATLVISKPIGMEYDAWSPYASNDSAHGSGVDGWTNKFSVIPGSQARVEYWDAASLRSDDPKVAERNVSSLQVKLTGSDAYTIYLHDSPVSDNRGGLSLRIDIA